MGKHENKSKIKEFILGTVVTIISGYFGLLGFPALLLIYPSFAIAIGVKRGIDYNIGIMTISSFVLSIAHGYVYAPIFFGYIGLAYILNLGINKNKRISKIVTEGATYTFVLLSCLMVLIKLYFKVDIMDEVRTLLESNLIASLEGLESIDTAYDIGALRKTMEDLIETVLIALPSILLMISLGASAISYGIASYMIRKNGIKYIPPFRLADFRLSYSFSLSVVIMLLITIAMNMIRIGSYEILTANLTFIIFTLLFVQGLGVTSFMLIKNKINKFLRVLIIIFLIISSYASIIVSLVGAFDVMFNFRKLKDR